ncbi:MAG: GIDE domain-containing protein [Haloarculaceae archaeon]
MLQSAAPLPALGIVAVVALFALGTGLREGLRARRLRVTRPTPVAGLAGATGRVVVSGVVRRAEGAVRAQFTGRDCLACTWRVTGLRTIRGSDGSVRTEQREVDRGQQVVPFLVEDTTGRVLVDPAAADLRLAEAWLDDYAADDGPEPADGGLPAPGGEARHRRYYEARLGEGETVVVHGTVSPDEESVLAGRVGVRVGGSGTLISDTDPGTAAGQALRAAAYATAVGLLALALLAVLAGVVPG